MENIEVLVVDDSAFNRQTIKKMLESNGRIEVVDTAYGGKNAIKRILKLEPDLITLDLEMPGMNGFEVLRWIMANHPLPVIVVSSKGDDRSVFKALELGAMDFIIKPTSRASLDLKEIREDLLEKVLAAKEIDIDRVKEKVEHSQEKVPEEKEKELIDEAGEEWQADVVLVGASTGGPSTIQTLLTGIPAGLSVTMVIAQHMPSVFTRLFAERMDRLSSISVREASDGEILEQGTAYIAPGGNQLRIARGEEDQYRFRITPAEDSDRYTPSVDTLFKSAAKVMGDKKKILGVILTGMGHDGKEGMKSLVEKGGRGIAESLDSAVISTMPEEVIKSNLVENAYNLEDLSAEIIKRSKDGG